MKAFLVLIACLFSFSAFAQRSPAGDSTAGKEMLTSITYGTLAGTLVGAASLAFTDNPGDNLQRVARGASLGLYTGILLGVYVAYMVSAGPAEINYEQRLPGEVMNFDLQPELDQKGSLVGARLQYNVLNF